MESYYGFIYNRFFFQIDRKIRWTEGLQMHDFAYEILTYFDENVFMFDDRIKICLFPSNIRLPTQLDYLKYFHLKNIDRIYYSCKCIYAHDNFRRDDNYIIFRLRFENQILYVKLDYFVVMRKVIFGNQRYIFHRQISVGGYAFICADPNLFMNLVFKTFTKKKEKKSYFQSLIEDNVKVDDGLNSLMYFGPNKKAIYKSLKEDIGEEVKSLTFMCYDIVSDNEEKFLSNFPHCPTVLKNIIKEICNVKEEYKENVIQTNKMKRKVVQHWEYDKRRKFYLSSGGRGGVELNRRIFEMGFR